MSSRAAVISWALLLIFVILLKPVLSNFFLPLQNGKPKTQNAKNAVMTGFFVSLIIPATHFNSNTQVIFTMWQYLNLPTFLMNLDLCLDTYSCLFIPVALFVTWSIIEFAGWYMDSDPKTDLFMDYLLVFLVAMITLVSANSLLQLFIGWEGVGIMSFLLIGWWFGRDAANTAAMQAVLYNRIGDIGFILALAWAATKAGAWDLQMIINAPKQLNLIPFAFGMILAATGKSAQFGLHPWLPAAMEGPTPVSALLHSSTMVVAGIFLLIRISPVLAKYPHALTLCLCLGALTTFYAAMCALTQNDIKKIIAFSTSSQLGLMMVTIGLNQPELAFFHMCTHAFFKAMLFLCAGSLIHNLNDEQDVRKMGGMQDLMPVTTSCLAIGSLALAGTPYLSGFYSKDAIVEAMMTSHVNAAALALTLFAISLTAIYSLRLAICVCSDFPRLNPLYFMQEVDTCATIPIIRLALGSIIAGWLILNLMVPPPNLVFTLPPHIKAMALCVTLVGILFGQGVITDSMQQSSSEPPYKPLHIFLSLLGFFSTTLHKSLPKLMLKVGQTITHLIDQLWLEIFGPKTMSDTSRPAAETTNDMQKGHIKVFLIMFFLSLIVTVAAVLFILT